ncbi:unnamed protein product [Leptidea sinapis]|uniref:Uncharacterized protein n=1 Tax=Leptidea sinapis TaxID=189913 RepID=A0A5E4QTN9_9NEOP|nr:unnamed protein product [Leptidea sinapis]
MIAKKVLQDFLTTYKNCNLNLVKIMEKICDTPLIEFDIYNVFEIKVLRETIRNMESAAVTKILDMYKEVVVYVIIVYEGFEPYIGQSRIHTVPNFTKSVLIPFAMPIICDSLYTLFYM